MPHAQPLQLPPALSGQFRLPGVDVGVYRLFLIVVGALLAACLIPVVSGAQHPIPRGNPTRVASRAIDLSTDLPFSSADVGFPLVGDDLGGRDQFVVPAMHDVRRHLQMATAAEAAIYGHADGVPGEVPLPVCGEWVF